MRTYFQCAGGFGDITWPDGRALLDQPARLVTAFNVIRDTIAVMDKKSGQA